MIYSSVNFYKQNCDIELLAGDQAQKPKICMKSVGKLRDYRMSNELEREPVQGCEQEKEWLVLKNGAPVESQRQRWLQSRIASRSSSSCLP